MHTHVTQNTSENLDLPVPVLTQSVSNPRNESMKIASANLRPALSPLLVPELDESKYEVIARARRLLAAKLAELEKVPVRVVKLADAEAVEAQCAEKLQREDIRPLEKALSYTSLLEHGNPTTSPTSPISFHCNYG